MTVETVIIPVFFIILSILTLWFVIGSKGQWWLKAFVMVVVPTLCFIVWMSVEAMLGWPVDQIPDGTYDIVAVDIQEPNSSKEIIGSIYIWIKNIDDEAAYDVFKEEEKHKTKLEPRSHRMPYTRELHKQMRKVQEALKKGATVRVQIKPKEGSNSSGQQEPEMKLYILPPPKALKGGMAPPIPRPMPPPQQLRQPADPSKSA